MKSVMLCNIIVKSVFAICVTVAAICFGRVGILWWYLLLLGIGYDYHREPAKKGATDERAD